MSEGYSEYSTRKKSEDSSDDNKWEGKLCKPSCSENYTGSNGGMEPEAVLKVLDHSLAVYGVRYTVCL
jgi:hypothetical protein